MHHRMCILVLAEFERRLVATRFDRAGGKDTTMTTTPRYTEPSEYGGSDDHYRTPDGSPRTLTTGERARLLRTAGIRDAATIDPSEPYELGERVG